MRNKHAAFCREYVKDFNATKAALRAGYSERTAYSQGPRLLKNVEVMAAIDRLVIERSMGPDEVRLRLADQARGDIGVFFEIREEWTLYPLPTYDILGYEEREVNEETHEKKVFFLVRHVVLDSDRLVDPRYTPLIRKFSDSPRSGLSIEIYDAHAALVDIGRYHKLFTDKVEHDASESILSRLDKYQQVMELVYGSKPADSG